jgi:hypothetical protein
MQNGGVGTFAPVQTLSSLVRNAMFAAPNGDVYCIDLYSTLYKQSLGAGTFTVVTSISNVRCGVAAYNGDIYLAAYNGDIYKQTGGTGSFVAQGQTARTWAYMTATVNGNIHVGDENNVYTRVAGTGNFIYNAPHNGYSLWSNQAGELFTVGYGNPLKKQTSFGNEFTNTGEMMQQYNINGAALAPNGNVYITHRFDLWLQNNFTVGTPDLDGGTLKQIAGTGKGAGKSRWEVWTGQKQATRTDMQPEILREYIDENGYHVFTAIPTYDTDFQADDDENLPQGAIYKIQGYRTISIKL